MLATYEFMDERYVCVVDEDDVVHRREIVIENELDDIFVIEKGVGVSDRIVLEGDRRFATARRSNPSFVARKNSIANQKTTQNSN